MTFQEANVYLNEKSNLIGQSLITKDKNKMLFVAPLKQDNIFYKYLEHLFKNYDINTFINLNNIVDFDVYISYTSVNQQKAIMYESLSEVITYLENQQIEP